MKRKRIIILCLLLSTAIFFTACAGMSPTQRGAVGGAAVGAIAGQLIGGNTSSTLIGAGAGALGGALLNDQLDKSGKSL